MYLFEEHNVSQTEESIHNISTWSFPLPLWSVSQCVCIPLCQTTGVLTDTHTQLLTCKVTDRQPSTQTNWHSSPLTVLQKSCILLSSRGCRLSQHTNLYIYPCTSSWPISSAAFLPQFHDGIAVLNGSVGSTGGFIRLYYV